jgi:predicted nucleic acid-binding protein
MNIDPQVYYFLDTNILVYAYDLSAGEKNRIASQVVRDCWEHENGCLSIQVLQELFVNVTRKINDPLDHQTARQMVADLAEWRLQIPEASDLLQVIGFQESYQLPFWDAMIVQSAARLGCKQLLSEDFNHGQMYDNVQVTNPFKEAD